MDQKPLRRTKSDRRLAGVCGGIGNHWNVDPLKIRLVVGSLAIAGIFTAGISTMLLIAIYVFAWLLIPEEQDDIQRRLEP